MAEKSNNPKISSTLWSNKPVKMKLFGAWEIDKTPSDCIPRLCSLNITRLTWNKSFGNDVTAIMVAVKMQNSKRILRSNEITIPSFNEHLSTCDIELDLSFTLQYPHFIKRNRNYLQIILQRRKKYKNKAILGYKTLACGLIDMVEVLQRSTISEKNLELIGRVKDSGKNDTIAKITISSLKSQPIDQESNLRRGKVSIDRPDYSDDEDFTSAEDGSDSETIEETGNAISFRRKLNEARNKRNKLFVGNNEKFGRSVVPTNVQQQRNLKQKFISLLKKFRLPDSEAYDSEEKFQEALEKELMSSHHQEPPDIDEFFDDEEIDDLDYMTDSGQEFDDVSISSTPKPSLRPFFSSCTLVGQDKSYEFPLSDNKKDESQETSGTEGTPETSDTSQKQTTFEQTQQQQQQQAQEPSSSTSKASKKLSFEKESSQKKVRLIPREKSGDSSGGGRHKEKHSHQHKERDKKSFHTALSLLSTTATTTANYVKDDNSSKEFVLEQLNKIFPSSNETNEQNNIPEVIIFINLSECYSHTSSGGSNQQQQQPINQSSLYQYFLDRPNHHHHHQQQQHHNIIGTNTLNDVKYAFNFLCQRIQKYCNNNMKILAPIKIGLIGSDSYVNSFLKFYVDSLVIKSPEWQNYLRFYIIPPSTFIHHHYHQQPHPSMMLHKYLSSIDSSYSNCFFNQQQNKEFDSSRNNDNNVIPSSSSSSSIMEDFYNKIINFMNTAQTLIQIPIAEAMVTFKDKNLDMDESNQIFVPFICYAKIGLADSNSYGGNHSTEDEISAAMNSSSNTSMIQNMSNEKCITSPTSTQQKDSQQQQQPHSSQTPPNSPSISAPNSMNTSQQLNQSGTGGSSGGKDSNSYEVIDLQVDYWTLQQPKLLDPSSSSSNKKGIEKITIKNSFRSLQISRLPNYGETNSSSLTFSYITKEKKQKIMRLGKKKEKDLDNKCQIIDGICRLVCSYKTSQSPIKVIIDGVEYTGVKFFQLTPQWQTQIKFFPIVIYSNNNNNTIASTIMASSSTNNNQDNNNLLLTQQMNNLNITTASTNLQKAQQSTKP